MMTKSRALARARLTLGKTAHVEARNQPRKAKDGTVSMVMTYTVGHINGLSGVRFFSVDGQGDTWEEALDRADRSKRARSISLLPEEWEAIVASCDLQALAQSNQGAFDRLHEFIMFVRREEAARTG